MHKINVSSFSADDLKALTTNAKLALAALPCPQQSLNQVRHLVARIFGAKSWQSLSAAATGQSGQPAAAVTWVGIRNVRGNGWDPETSFVSRFVADSEEALYIEMANDFCSSAVDSILSNYDFEDDEAIEKNLREAGIKDEARVAELAAAICAGADEICDLLTPRELVAVYLNTWGDEETITVEAFPVSGKPAKPAVIQEQIFARHEGRHGLTTLAILRAEVESDDVPLLERLQAGVTAWVAEHEEGRSAWNGSCQDFNVGDLAGYLSSKSLAACLSKAGMKILSLHICDPQQSAAAFDTVLADAPDDQQ